MRTFYEISSANAEIIKEIFNVCPAELAMFRESFEKQLREQESGEINLSRYLDERNSKLGKISFCHEGR